jgi:hypothetical protein
MQELGYLGKIVSDDPERHAKIASEDTMSRVALQVENESAAEMWR